MRTLSNNSMFFPTYIHVIKILRKKCKIHSKIQALEEEIFI